MPSNESQSSPTKNYRGSPPLLSIVVPAYSEERRLPTAIGDMKTFFSRFPSVEILIVIEKSKDQTVELARKAAEGTEFIQIIANNVQRGKGYAVNCGMLRAQGQYVFFMDADLSTPLAEVIKFLAEFETHPDIDVLIGSRALAQSRIIKKQTWIRRNMGRSFNKLVQLFGVRGISDTQCGFKAFRQHTVKPIFTRQTLQGFAFDVEILLLAQKLGYKIQPVPVRWVNSPDSKVRIWLDPLKMFLDLLRIRYRVRQTLREKPLLIKPDSTAQ